MSKKINPRRRPVNMADVERAKAEARDEAIQFCWAILFTVLADKYAVNDATMAEIWDHVNNLSMSIAEGRITVADLKNVLKEEYGLCLK